ncbi:MAG: hypothetical protein ACT4RN_16295 [Pseudonocardia sp.]
MRFPGTNPEQLMAQFNTNVDGYFTFSGCGRHIREGQVCQLGTPIGKAPVRVVAVSATGFALRSLPGHPEGADRTITFRFVTADVVGNASLKALHVDAWGPVSGASVLGPLNSATVAQASLQIFTDNINSRFPKNPPPVGAV